MPRTPFRLLMIAMSPTRIESLYTRYLFIVVFVFLIFLTFLILHPLLNVFLWSLILAYLFYPLFTWFNTNTAKPNLSALITVVIMMLIVITPLFLIVKGISGEAFIFYTTMREQVKDGSISLSILSDDCALKEGAQQSFCSAIQSADNVIQTFFPQEIMKEVLNKSLSWLITKMVNFALHLPSLMFSIAISIFITFFVMRDWQKFKASLYDYVPFQVDDMEKIFHRINTMTYSIIFASILVAVIQGLLGMVGFFVVGFKSPILMGVIMGFFALIPILGTGIVWAPASLYLFIKGISGGQDLLVYQGIGLFLYGALIISTIDNFIRPKLAGDRAKVHPVLILSGVIGGASLLGFIGIFIGPVILALTLTFVKLAIEKYHFEHPRK